MKVAAIQHDINWEQAEATRERVAPMIAKAAADDARLIVLPEMFATGFSMRPDRIAEDEGGPTEQFLLEQAAEHGATVIASIAQRGPDGRFRNMAVLAGPDGQLYRYDKIHPFSYAGEHLCYQAGSNFLTVTVEDLRVSIFICYDLRFADEFWALAADTDLYLVLANWPEPRREHWRALLRARAIENQAYVLGVNRVGTAKNLRYDGGSVVVDPLGVRLVEGGTDSAVLTADVTPEVVTQIRADFPFLSDRR
jgi:predicted amidohydrolase